MLNSGLYIVSTPIGNLKDISFRVLEILEHVDFLYSENKLETSKILNKHNIKRRQGTYRDENKHKVIPEIISLLEAGNSVALVSDSGTPLISDPGFKLVTEARKRNLNVFTIPGPSAVISALSISGLPTDKFTFVGFLPKKGNDRAKTIIEYGALDATLIIYESPYRVKKTLQDIYSLLGNRYMSVAKELTKLHETVFYGKVEELVKILPDGKQKGEFVILVAKQGFLP